MEEKIISESLTKDFRHHLAREERSDSTIEKCKGNLEICAVDERTAGYERRGV